jgi:hypothetical protein
MVKARKVEEGQLDPEIRAFLESGLQRHLQGQ